MKAKKLFLMECHLAGRKYHDADEVWEELKVGTKLKLVRDADNKHDVDAVALVYERPSEAENGECEEFCPFNILMSLKNGCLNVLMPVCY